jgi:hypothetical protein
MVDPSILAPVLSSVVGLVGVIVAGLSVYFNYKGRHNQFRQVVYSKQMDAYFDITEAMANLYNSAQNLIAFSGGLFQDDGARKQFRSALRDEHERFGEKVNRWLIVLPSKVKAALDHFHTTLWAISVPPEMGPAGRRDPALAGADDPGAALAQAYEKAVNCIRHHLAVDSLTKGMLREMGIGAESLSVRNMSRGAVRLVPVSRATP